MSGNKETGFSISYSDSILEWYNKEVIIPSFNKVIENFNNYDEIKQDLIRIFNNKQGQEKEVFYNQIQNLINSTGKEGGLYIDDTKSFIQNENLTYLFEIDQTDHYQPKIKSRGQELHFQGTYSQ